MVLNSMAAFVGVILLEGILLSYSLLWTVTQDDSVYWAYATLVKGSCQNHIHQGTLSE